MTFYQFVLYPLGHAAHHAHDEVRTLLAERTERLQAVQDFLLGIVAHGAGIQEYGIGLFRRRGRVIARHFHH